CLDRNVHTRLRDIGEARIVLENLANPSHQRGPEESPALVARERSKAAWVSVAVLAVALSLVGFGWWRATRILDRPLIHLSVDLGPDAVAGPRITAILSPDGTRIVFPIRLSNGVPQLATRTLDQPNATVMPGTEGGRDAFFSPDGLWIGFFADGKLKKAAVQGGAPVTLCDAPDPKGGSWSEDGSIIFSPAVDSGLMRVSSAGGAPKPLTKHGTNDVFQQWPQVLPGGKSVLFTSSANPFSWEDGDIGIISPDSGQTKIVQHGGYFGRYVPSPYGSGHLLYVHE